MCGGRGERLRVVVAVFFFSRPGGPALDGEAFVFYRSYRFPCSRCAAARAAVLIGAAWSLAGCARNGPPVEQPPPAVTVANPLLQEVTDYYEFPGRTAAVGEVEVRARVTGYIVKVHFEDGEEVEKGDLLFEIDPRPYEAALDRAKGELMHSRRRSPRPRRTSPVRKGSAPRAPSARTSTNSTPPRWRSPGPRSSRPRPRSARPN